VLTSFWNILTTVHDMVAQVVCVIGGAGVGKSYLLSQLFPEAAESFPHGEGEDHVTTAQRVVQLGGLTIIDSVGMDLNVNNYLDLSAYSGQRICMIFINNHLRYGNSLRRICERFGIEREDVNVFNSHFFTGCPELQHVMEAVNAYPYLETFTYQPHLQRATPEARLRNLNIQGGEARNRVNVNNLFPNSSVKQGLVVTLEKAQMLLPTREMVASYRMMGDAHVKLTCLRYLSKNDLPEATIDELITNARMKRFIVDFVGGERYIHNIYGGDDGIGDEAYADVFEAMFELRFLDRSPLFATLVHRFLTFE